MKDDTVLSIGGREVRVTHPDKLYFSKQTKLSKLDLVRYYLSVSGCSHGNPRSSAGSQALRRRRRRRGVLSEARPRQAAQWLRTVALSFPSGRKAEEVVVDDAAGLAWIVNLGCIELHPHPVRSSDLEHPDELRVDLDPGPGVNWRDVRRVALEVKSLLEEMGLRGWAKTSGSRGMHVNVRIQQRWAFDEVRAPHSRYRVKWSDAYRAWLFEVVEGGASRRFPRLQPEREGPHYLLGVFRAPASRRPCVHATPLA